MDVKSAHIWKHSGAIPNISSSELVSLPGYHKSSTNEHGRKVIDSILGSSKKDDMIIAYSILLLEYFCLVNQISVMLPLYY